MDNSINHKNSNNHSMDNKYLNSNLDNETESKINYVQNNFVYGWGRNKNGELGLGKNSLEYYSSPQAVKSLKNINVIQIASGGKHTAILTTNGKLYVCGTHILGLLGIDNKEYKDFSIFQKLTTLDHEVIVEVHCAEFHTLCLTNTGQVYAWGGSLHKKLGMNSTGGLPTRVNGLSNRRITQISCGDYHSCALTDSGEIFSWGGGGVSYNKGQCGHGDLKDYDTPKKIDYFKNKRIVKVVCGGYHTLSLTEENKLYGFGKGNFGQCGYGEFEDAPSPKLILFNKKFETFENPFYDKRITSQSQQSNFVIKDIKCGGYHSVILSAMGKVYTFGHNMNGQLGLGDTKNHSSPELVKSIMKKNIVMIGAGWSHTFVLTDHGNLYSCGSAKYGELGLDDKEDKKNFILIKKVDHLNISNIGAGGHHTWIILDTINPIKRDYHSPSPIVSGTGSPKKSNTPSPKHINQTDMTNKSRLQESSFQQQSKPARKEKIKLNMDLLSEKNPCDKVFLQVAFTDLKMSHRFLRFTLCSKFKDITLRDFTKKISDYLKKDQCVEFFRLQDDSDVLNFTDHGLTSLYKDIKNSFKLLEMSKKLNYSLCIVYDLNKIPQILNIKCDLENRKKRAETKSIYDVLILSRDDIISNDIERVLSYWTIDFQEFFSEVIEENIKFLELRPNSFYI